MQDSSEFLTFCEFCSRCFTSGIVWTPPPIAECIAGQILDWTFPLQSRFACVVHVRVCTCVFTQECGFVLHPPSVAFLWGIFPESFSCCYENLIQLVFLTMARSHDLLWNTPVSSLWRSVDLAVRYNGCFSSKETLPSWSGKPRPSASRKNISTCPKNFRASCMKRGRPRTTFPWSLQGIYPGTPSDATPFKLGYLGQVAVEEWSVLVLHPYLIQLKSQLCNSMQHVLQNERPQIAAAGSLCGTGFSCLVCTCIFSSVYFPCQDSLRFICLCQKHKSTFCRQLL